MMVVAPRSFHNHLTVAPFMAMHRGWPPRDAPKGEGTRKSQRVFVATSQAAAASTMVHPWWFQAPARLQVGIYDSSGEAESPEMASHGNKKILGSDGRKVEPCHAMADYWKDL